MGVFVTTLNFDNRFISHFTGDELTENYPRQVKAPYSYVTPKSFSQLRLISVTNSLAKQLGIEVNNANAAHWASVLTGSKPLSGMQPFAYNYGGHQFGRWAGQLGDGRAINLGQIRTPQDSLITIQLKGAGPTPYSRSADGFAVLRSSIREFLCSEAMYHLGIPTTRALSLCLTGEQVARDMFYNGNVKLEPGAVVCRVSPSFLRFGTYQLPASRGDITLLKQLVDYTIVHDFNGQFECNQDGYLAWFREISRRTCDLIVEWMRVGFVHGVMNTDNMSIIGETIDYGPYGWIDNYDLHWTPNTTDANTKRYCFGAQPEIGQWNLFQLANALYPLIEDAQSLSQILTEYAERYHSKWLAMMASKLGLTTFIKESDEPLFNELEKLLTTLNVDMTIFYRLLATSFADLDDSWQHFLPSFYAPEQLTEQDKQLFLQWLEKYCARLAQQQDNTEQRIATMNRVNPKYVLRNYLAQQAIDKAEHGDYQELETLAAILKNPYHEQPGYEQYAQKRPKWADNKAGCSMLSCSS
ncbi:protein adenylyltransferase SelO [Thalassotalea ganghwensis]